MNRVPHNGIVFCDVSRLCVVLAILISLGCTSIRKTNQEFTNPVSGARVVIQSAYPAGRLAIRAGRGLFLRDILVGDQDWMFGSADALWTQDGMRVTLFVCGRISPPHVLTYDFELGEKVHDEAAVEALRTRTKNSFEGEPYGCSGNDPIEWACCDERELLKYRRSTQGAAAKSAGKRTPHGP